MNHSNDGGFPMRCADNDDRMNRRKGDFEFKYKFLEDDML